MTASAQQGTSSVPMFAGLALSILLGLFFISLTETSAKVDESYVPAANDSFYHAYRVLDGIEANGKLKQFDDRIQVPEGSWVHWPWAYDTLLMQIGRAALVIQPDSDPLATLAWVPPAWFIINAVLFFLITAYIGLTPTLRILAIVAYALLPLNQIGHGVAMFDHHFIEQTFVLATTWLALRWLAMPDKRNAAIALGVVFGMAPAFHNGLFVLQLPLLCALFIGWIRSDRVPVASAVAFAIAIVVTTLLMLLPSAAFRHWVFEFSLHSWFHAYVALGTAIGVGFMAWRRFSLNNLLILSGIAVAMALPIAADVLRGTAFLGTEFSILATISEARSPLQMIQGNEGLVDTASYYSWFLLLTPALLVGFAILAVKSDSGVKRVFAVTATLGLAMLLTQYRLYYYGVFIMIGGTFMAVQWLGQRLKLPTIAVVGLGVLILALGFRTSLSQRLFQIYPLGYDLSYAEARPVFEKLAEYCQREPGVVLASSDDGNFILFHTDCSIIANNFIMRDADARKIATIDRLYRSAPAEIRRDPLNIRYMVVRKIDFSLYEDDEYRVVDSNRVAKQLLLDDAPPPGYELLYSQYGGKDNELLIAKLYRVSPSLGSQ